MKNLFWAITLVIISSSCNETPEIVKQEQKTVVISGHLQLTDSLELEKITVYGYDMMSKKSFQEDALVNENGDFTTSFPLSSASALSVYGNNSFQIIAIPGDSIFINYTEGRDEAAFKKSITFSGKTATTQKTFQEYLASNPLKTEAFYKEESELDYNDLEKLIDDHTKKLKDYYKNYLDNKTLNKYLKDYIATDKKFAIINTKMDYASFANYYGKKVPEMDSPYYKELVHLPELTEEDMVNTNAANSILYNNHAFASREIEKKFPEATPQEINQVIIENAIKEGSYLSQHTVSMLVMGDLDDHSTKLYEENSEQLIDYLKNSSLLASIQQEYLKTKDLVENPQIPTEAELLTFKSDDASKFIDEIISNANGKVIYIDNWATWCGPCKAEFKEASPALHEKFKEDVEFVYLCHASKEKAYIPSIAEYQIKGKHYFLTEEQGRIVQQQINLEGFPTYTIFDKKGNRVLSDYIHRPSYGPTSNVLTRLVNDKKVDLANSSK
ncbi:TlpA disulfide reductase family protein [uncultured Nonlabens sp.]|uniref:TlpA family protein disulfide reductase n=1 Tax=uncultured Nonlabens sp. TaxID=859306 RepID=UPI0030D91CB2|tara:strand:- start:24790 stop:26286 length:1497 start_codon:yes stop_codon:yes gene_type:complete